MYQAVMDEFEYDEEEGEVRGVATDVGCEICGITCGARFGSFACLRGSTWRKVCGRVGKAVALATGLPLLTGPAAVWLSFVTLRDWETEGSSPEGRALSATVLTILYVITHVLFYMITGMAGVTKRNREVRVKHVAILTICLVVIVWGLRLKAEDGGAGVGVSTNDFYTFFQFTAVLLLIAQVLNLWLFFTSSGLCRGGPYKTHRRIRTRCCAKCRINKCYVLDAGRCLYRCQPCKIMYRLDDAGRKRLKEDKKKLERKLSVLLMKNQDSKAMQRRVKKFKQRITKYRKAYAARRALARAEESPAAVEMVRMSPATGGVAHGAAGPSSYERVPSQRDIP